MRHIYFMLCFLVAFISLPNNSLCESPKADNNKGNSMSLEELQSVFNSLKNVFDVFGSRINASPSTSKITGTLTCAKSCQNIPAGSVATVSLIEASQMDVSATTIGVQQINDVQTFPINFQIEYDETTFKVTPGSRFSVRAEIRNNGNLIYITDTSFDALDRVSQKLVSSIDISVIGVGNQELNLIMPSVETETSANWTKVFFYGTLKRNEPNYEHVLDKNAKFISEARTLDKWPLIIATHLNLPFLLDYKGYEKGKNIHGEIYLVDQSAKEWFDWFEGVSDNLYVCKKIDVVDTKTGQIHQAYSYLLENFKDELLNETAIMFESYSSKNQYFPEYEKFQDTPENTFNLLKQIKKNFY